MSMENNISRKKLLPIVIISMVGFILLDQAMKKMAISLLLLSPVYFNDFLGLEIYKNYGIAFGLPVNINVFYLIFILFIILLTSGKLLNFNEMRQKEILGVVLILSGALGNLIDRIKLGYIIDYMNFGNLVIFNLADVFIAAGIIILLEKFFPDTGRGKFKKNVYILLFMVFGVLISQLIHSALEIWYINLLIQDFSKYSLGLIWQHWYIIHGIGTVILFVGGLMFGYFQGKHWWKVLYEK